MSRYGAILTPANALTEFLESADPVDMTTRANLAIVAIGALAGNRRITSMDLAGGGDGHAFQLMIEHAPDADVTAGLIPANTTVACYMAAQSEELDVARGRVPVVALTSIEDELLAGASKGTRWMGAVVRGSSATPPDVNSAFGLLGGEDLDLSITAPSGVLTTGMALVAGGLLFDSPGAGGLRYTGARTGTFILDATVSLSVLTTFGGEMKIVTNPLVTPAQVGLPTDFVLAAALTANVSAHAFATLAQNQVVGIQLTDLDGNATVASAHIRAVQIA